MCIFPAEIKWLTLSLSGTENNKQDTRGESEYDVKATDGKNTKVGAAVQGRGATA